MDRGSENNEGGMDAGFAFEAQGVLNTLKAERLEWAESMNHRMVEMGFGMAQGGPIPEANEMLTNMLNTTTPSEAAAIEFVGARHTPFANQERMPLPRRRGMAAAMPPATATPMLTMAGAAAPPPPQQLPSPPAEPPHSCGESWYGESWYGDAPWTGLPRMGYAGGEGGLGSPTSECSSPAYSETTQRHAGSRMTSPEGALALPNPPELNSTSSSSTAITYAAPPLPPQMRPWRAEPRTAAAALAVNMAAWAAQSSSSPIQAEASNINNNKGVSFGPRPSLLDATPVRPSNRERRLAAMRPPPQQHPPTASMPVEAVAEAEAFEQEEEEEMCMLLDLVSELDQEEDEYAAAAQLHGPPPTAALATAMDRRVASLEDAMDRRWGQKLQAAAALPAPPGLQPQPASKKVLSVEMPRVEAPAATTALAVASDDLRVEVAHLKRELEREEVQQAAADVEVEEAGEGREEEEDVGNRQLTSEQLGGYWTSFGAGRNHNNTNRLIKKDFSSGNASSCSEPEEEAETETLLMLLRGLDRAERVAVREDEGLKASKREKARMKTGGPGGRQPLGVNRMRRGAQA